MGVFGHSQVFFCEDYFTQKNNCERRLFKNANSTQIPNSFPTVSYFVAYTKDTPAREYNISISTMKGAIFMKKIAVIGSTLAAVLVAGSMTIPAFAASNPTDNASGYSYNTGKQSYETRMAEDHAWYVGEDDSITSGYSWNAGSQAAQSRGNAFAEMPTGDDVAKEEIEAWFESKGIGNGAAYSNGQYDESAKSSYGYAKGQAAYQQRHASFSGNN